MQANYRDAIFSPHLPRVLGRQLLPLTLGHVHLLDALDSPYVGPGNQDFGELALAVWVCSQPWDTALAELEHPKAEKRLARRVARWKRRASRMTGSEWLEQRHTFNEYLSHYRQTARRVEDGAPAELRAPLSYTLVWLLAGKRWPTLDQEHSYLSMPLVKAFAIISTANAVEGDDSLMTDKEALIADNFDRLKGLN